ncbi:hypothetical protein F5148DRAFT_1292122 [Russula earlei]|uniref:Uncharacterized protein n=1 Tax=Russula earlei TaxID=71964 RepID=A0ACC0TTN9_9AGAM|nr:hypothetical protein F5148DRAFT_1292122 [Russula earlei]
MKLTIRPLGKGKAVFPVEAEPSHTISELKRRISDEQGYPIESQNILSSGKSLQNDKTLGSYNVKDGGTLILVLKSAPSISASGSSSNSPRTASVIPVSAPRPSTLAHAPAPVSLNSGSAFGGSGLSSNAGPLQANVDKIMTTGMGFKKEQVELALRASDNNPDQAFELLLSGVADDLGDGSFYRAAPSSQPPNFPSNLSNFAPSGASSTPGFPQGPFQPSPQQPQPRRDPGFMGGIGGSDAQSALGGLASSGNSGGAVPEIDPAQVLAIRRMVAENPALTGPLIKHLMETDPEGAKDLSVDDPDGILRYFSQLGEDYATAPSGQGARLRAPAAPVPGPGPALVPVTSRPPPGSNDVTLTPAEAAFIEKASLSDPILPEAVSSDPASKRRWKP